LLLVPSRLVKLQFPLLPCGYPAHLLRPVARCDL
jgi:hypothetical protein